MMSVRLLVVGTLKETYWSLAQTEYGKRLSRFIKLDILELAEANNKSERVAEIELAKQQEGERILAKIKPDDFVILLDGRGENISSEFFAERLEQWSLRASQLTFVIGGSYGVSELVQQRANWLWSFGAQTFPHQMMRIMVLEQVYRGWMILHHQPYHK
ncbi:MAG: 23S rRNA (pseudouridine(1915)-N(3))-methyltransferase RlmH [Bacilli bacterium]